MTEDFIVVRVVLVCVTVRTMLLQWPLEQGRMGMRTLALYAVGGVGMSILPGRKRLSDPTP